jgi:hypothetical protein
MNVFLCRDMLFSGQLLQLSNALVSFDLNETLGPHTDARTRLSFDVLIAE